MQRLLVLILLLAFASAQGSLSQTPVSPAEPAPGKETPVSHAALTVKVPRAREIHLDNGLTILLIEDHRLPEISMTLQIRGAGSLFDPPEMTGLADATAEMLSHGTASHTGKEIAEEREFLSADINAYSSTSSPETVFVMSGLSENFDQWFALGIDEFLHPAFPPEEWDQMRQQWLANMRTKRGNPNFLASERFTKAVFGAQAAGATQTSATLQTITVDAMRQWYTEHYAPQQAILGIVGDVRPDTLLPRLKAALYSWKRNDSQTPAVPDPSAVAESRILLVDRPGAVQTTLVAGNIGLSRRDPDYLTFQVARELLRINMTQNLAFGHGYAYISAVNVYFGAGEYAGPWRVQVPFRSEVTGEALTEILGEVLKIRGDKPHDEKVFTDRLERAKANLVGNFAFSLERPGTALGCAMDSSLYGLPEDYWDTYIAKTSAVTAADVRRVARKYFSTDTIQIVAVGDASKIRSVLEKFGKVTVFDSGGNLLP